jgi:hypothetical protein
MTETFNLMPNIGEYPIVFPAVAAHVQMRHVTEDNWPELQRRVAAIEDLYGLMYKDAEGQLISVATEEECRRTIGQTMNWGDITAAQFDEYMECKRIEKAGGFPGVWRHFVRDTPQLGYPVEVYIENERKDDQEERRRVLVYPDGSMEYGWHGLTAEDGEEFDPKFASTKHTPKWWTEKPLTQARFEEIWTLAEDGNCTWVTGDADGVQRCGDIAEGGLCDEHRAAAHASLPYLVPAAFERHIRF